MPRNRWLLYGATKKGEVVITPSFSILQAEVGKLFYGKTKRMKSSLITSFSTL
ncbi:MAG: hypothetical protein LBH80_02515 [Prevotellaceae bacterium]|nr:hypothetical protein [Prevotellaceae bacterium]